MYELLGCTIVVCVREVAPSGIFPSFGIKSTVEPDSRPCSPSVRPVFAPRKPSVASSLGPIQGHSFILACPASPVAPAGISVRDQAMTRNLKSILLSTILPAALVAVCGWYWPFAERTPGLRLPGIVETQEV